MPFGHGIGGARQVDVGDIGEGVLDQAAAVEALARAAAAPTIGRAQYIHCAAEHVAALLGRHGHDGQIARSLGGIAWAGAQGAVFDRRVFHRGVGGIAGETIGKTLLTIGGVGGQGQQ